PFKAATRVRIPSGSLRHSCSSALASRERPMPKGKNVLGTELAVCCRSPRTGFYRTGYCDTGPGDVGLHVVCARMTDEFLDFSRDQGNDLSTPVPEWN